MSATIGVGFGVDGGSPLSVPRIGNHYEAILAQAHGKYYETTSRGNMFVITTGATGRAPGTALGVTPPILLYNPVGSNKRLAIKKVAAGYVSGTLGAGTLFHCGFTFNGVTGSQTSVAPVIGSGAALTPINLDLGSAAVSVAVAFALGTLNANPVFLYPFCSLEAQSGSADIGPVDILEDVDGNICLEPGAGYCLEAKAAAGTSPLMAFGILWEEVNLIG